MPKGPPAPSPEAQRTPLSQASASPNYAARRMLVAAVGVAAVVAGGLVVWRTLGGESDDIESDAGDWNEVVLVDRADGAVTTVDKDGAVGSHALPTGRTIDVHVEGARVALVEASQIALTDVDGRAPTIIPIAAGSVVTRLSIEGSLWLAVGRASGGNVLLIDALTGNTFDVAALAGQAEPRFYTETIRYDPKGVVFAIADAANFQTILVDTGADDPAAEFFPDQPLAVDTEHVVTSQVVGRQADLTLFDRDRKNLATVPEELPAGGTITDDGVVVASINGTISRFDEGDIESERLGTVAVPSGTTIRWIRPTANNTRWVVFGDVFEAVVDLTGRTVFTTTFTTAVESPKIGAAWRCLPVGGGATYHSLIDLESGEQLSDLSGLTVTGVSADGCTVLGTRAGVTEIVGHDGSVPVGQFRSATLAPDGRSIVLQTSAGAVQLVTIDDEWALGQPVDISDHAPTNPIVTFRNR